MSAFFAIVKLTLRDARRSNIFRLLLGFLLLSAFLPMFVEGSGGGMRGNIQVMISYSLGAISFILVISTVWLSSLVMTQDVENYQLHMVVSKPVSRINIFLAKYCSVVLIHAVLLLIAGSVAFGLVVWKFNTAAAEAEKNDDWARKNEVERIKNEVMVGRRVFLPKPPDTQKLTDEALKRKMAELQQEGRGVTAEALEMEDEIRKSYSEEMMRKRSAVLYGDYGSWEFENMPENLKEPIYLRYRFYIGKVDSEAQRPSLGVWEVYLTTVNQNKDGETSQEDYIRSWVKLPPRDDYAGEFHEITFPEGDKIIDPEHNTVSLRYLNADPEKAQAFFQAEDGPQLLIKVTGFTGNFVRGLLVILLLLMVYGGISCAAASAFSMPTAIFVVLSYMFLGSVAPLIKTTSQLRDATEYTGYWIGEVVMKVVAPLQDFDVSQKLAGGELVEFSFMGGLILWHFLLQACPCIVLGGYINWRRELGLVIRK